MAIFIFLGNARGVDDTYTSFLLLYFIFFLFEFWCVLVMGVLDGKAIRSFILMRSCYC
jgi:hypothetical protein